MSAPQTPFPSPLAGEGAERQRREAGEGASSLLRTCGTPPHPASRTMSAQPPSPARGEGGASSAEAFSEAPDAKPSKTGAKGRSLPVVATKANAKALRRRMTDAEQKLWQALRSRELAGMKFRRQVPVGPYVADFLSYQQRLVVEVDGGQHAESTKDRVRDAWFGRNGFQVMRFWNHDVLGNLDGVLIAIAQHRTAALSGQVQS